MSRNPNRRDRMQLSNNADYSLNMRNVTVWMGGLQQASNV
jgi:hypothetical protein